MKPQEFFSKYDGKGLDYDGRYGFQCMDVFRYYENEVTGGKSKPGNAVDMWENYDRNAYDRIANSLTGVPKEGDVVIWGKSVGQYGHIAVFVKGDVNSFVAFGQNWPVAIDKDGNGYGKAHFQPHSYNGVTGWLRPKKLNEKPMKVVQVYRHSNDATVRGIVEYETMEEVHATGHDIVLYGPATLVKDSDNPEVSVKYGIPTFDSVKYLGLTPEKNLKVDSSKETIKSLQAISLEAEKEIAKLTEELEKEKLLHEDTKRSADEIIISLKRDLEACKGDKSPSYETPEAKQVHGFVSKAIAFIRNLLK